MISYSDWLERHIVNRQRPQQSDRHLIRFSLLTTLYTGTQANFLAELRDSVLVQTHPNWEWVVLMHGPVTSDVEELVGHLQNDGRIRVHRLPTNLGPMGGLRKCLEAATGEYIMPMDADDLLTVDALEVMADVISEQQRPAYLYSDEDHLFDGMPSTPFLRPDEDPVLLMTGSYIWHLCAFRRDIALQLGLFTDLSCEWCHDWDTAWRFASAGFRLVHVPQVLYHWRHHKASSTNRPDPETGSLASQRRVLQRLLVSRTDSDKFTIEEFPIFRGAFEWWIRRRQVEPEPIDVIMYGPTVKMAESCCELIRGCRYPIRSVHLLGDRLTDRDYVRVADVLTATGGGTVRIVRDLGPSALTNILEETQGKWTVFCRSDVRVASGEWAWDTDKVFRLHSDTVAVTGRLMGGDNRVLAAAEVLGFNGIVGSPEAGQTANDAGYFAFSLKHRSCSAPSPELCIVDKRFVSHVVKQLPSRASWEGFGAWIGGAAVAAGKRVVYTPILQGNIAAFARKPMDPAEVSDFADRYGRYLPDTRWYSRHFRLTGGLGYTLLPPAEALRLGRGN